MADEDSILIITTQVGAVISTMADIFILLMYIRHKKLQTLAFGFVRNMAIADFCSSFSNVWGGFDSSDILCYIQGYLNTFGGASTFLWVGIVAIVMYSVMYYGPFWEDHEKVTKLTKILPFIGFGLPALWSFLPFITNSYGYVGGWCWINNNTHSMGNVWRWLLFYGVLIFVVILVIILYGIIMYRVKKTSKILHKKSGVDVSDDNKINLKRRKSIELQQKQQKQIFNRIKWYPFALVFGRTPSILNRFLQLFGDTPFWLKFCHALFSSLYGFLNAIIYGLTPKVKRLVKQEIKSCPCVNNNENENERKDSKVESQTETISPKTK